MSPKQYSECWPTLFVKFTICGVVATGCAHASTAKDIYSESPLSRLLLTLSSTTWKHEPWGDHHYPPHDCRLWTLLTSENSTGGRSNFSNGTKSNKSLAVLHFNDCNDNGQFNLTLNLAVMKHTITLMKPSIKPDSQLLTHLDCSYQPVAGGSVLQQNINTSITVQVCCNFQLAATKSLCLCEAL